MKLTYALVVMSLGVPLCSANLISNGDFETNPAIGAGNFSILGTGDTTFLPGWKVIGTACATNCVLALHTPYSEGALVFQPESGDQSVDLSGAGNTVDGGVEQTVATTIGTNYTLSFWVGNMDNAGSGYGLPSSLQVRVTGVPDVILRTTTARPTT